MKLLTRDDLGALAAALAVPSLALLCLAAPPPASPEAALEQATLDRIQRECLRAYPPDVLAEMAAGSEEIPAEVEADPKAQMQFLSREIPLDKGLFYPSLLEELLPVFQQYVFPGTRFLDLGSGDGRALFLANVLGADAVGIEYDEEMVEVSLRARDALEGLVDPDRVRVIQGDFFESSWSGYDVVYYFDLSSFEGDRLRQKIARELDPGAVLLVGHEQKPFPGLELEASFPDWRRLPDVKAYRQPAEAAPKAAGSPPSGDP